MDIFYAFFGVIVGLISGFFGIGGGGVIVPVLLLTGYDIKSAIGISVMQMLFSSMFGSYFNYKAGRLKLNNGILVGIGGLFGASFSGLLVKFIPSIYLQIAFFTTMILSLLKLYINPKKAQVIKNNNFILIFIGFFVGAIAISIGIGGSIFITPILISFLGYDIKNAKNIGLFFVAFSSLSGFISMSFQNLIAYDKGAIIGITSILGVYFGTKISHNMQDKTLKILFTFFYIIMGSITLLKILNH